MGSAVLTMAALLAACGGSSSDSNQKPGNYEVKVTSASFPAKQFVGQTSLLKVDAQNAGDKTVPDLTVTVDIEGKYGEAARIPFAVHDPQPGLANGDRPVWVLSATYPRLEGSKVPGGAETSAPKTYAFGEVKPGQTVEAVWKLSAVRPGKYTVAYEIDAGLGLETKAVTAGGSPPGGTFVTKISTALPETEVNGAGEIVEMKSGTKEGG
ncbi:MAG TPA: hypothetical protein VN671_02570 [Solirubrobacterales bacterium]|nr:hypothetical protein [Solirubrobacterales bacterium]